MIPVGLVLVMLFAGTAAQAAENDMRAEITSDYEQYLGEKFLHFHQNPELSFLESKTAALMAQELRAIGVDVTENVGGTGVVGMIRNGEGPLVMVRADMDGLPVKEDSGLDYMSKVTQVNLKGDEVPVMHACGHDVHITSLLGTARQLMKHKDDWTGTVMLIVQPAEERGGGARAMLEDGLYERFGVPDFALALHVWAGEPAGRIDVPPGPAYSSADSVDIIVRGVGSHGASPHKGKDPIYIGSQIVIALQGIVSREIAPLRPAVITVGAFQSGFKHNIISDKAHLQLTVRSNDIETRDHLLAAIERIAKNVGRMNGLSEEMLPEVIVSETETTPPTVNDHALSVRVRAAIAAEMGEDMLYASDYEGMGAEDFSRFTMTDDEVPGCYFRLGGTPQSELDAEKAGGPAVPSNHSPFFRVDPEPSVVSGTQAMTAAVLDLLAN
jgi:hippurate hydrolase